MGRVLFIRVSAVTYDEAAVQKAWPTLHALAWPDASVAGAGSPAVAVRQGMGAPVRGVPELLDTLVEQVRFGSLASEQKSALTPYAERLTSLREGLDAALGDRNVPAAHTLTNAIEDALDDAEKACSAG